MLLLDGDSIFELIVFSLNYPSETRPRQVLYYSDPLTKSQHKASGAALLWGLGSIRFSAALSLPFDKLRTSLDCRFR